MDDLWDKVRCQKCHASHSPLIIPPCDQIKQPLPLNEGCDIDDFYNILQLFLALLHLYQPITPVSRAVLGSSRPLGLVSVPLRLDGPSSAHEMGKECNKRTRPDSTKLTAGYMFASVCVCAYASWPHVPMRKRIRYRKRPRWH